MEDRFDLDRFKRAVGARADRHAFVIDVSDPEYWAFMKRNMPEPFFSVDEEANARRKLIAQAERYGEEMHESRHDA